MPDKANFTAKLYNLDYLRTLVAGMGFTLTRGRGAAHPYAPTGTYDRNTKNPLTAGGFSFRVGRARIGARMA